jgi:circadian clock protein KaiC
MRSKPNAGNSPASKLRKSRTGITGFDELTLGGLPEGRPTIVCGGPGCGKTMFAAEFLARGAQQFDEPGVLMAFEESAEDIAKNVASLGFDLKHLETQKKLAMDYVRIEPAEIHETGAYDLEGLFVRLQHAVDSVKAKRVVLDTLEAVFSAFSDTAVLRAEIRRLFRWLKDRGLTAVITAERGSDTLTRYGLEEYVSDCVIFLDHRISEQISTRRLRVVKYRGSSHGADEYPFLIDDRGFSVLPITSMRLDHQVSTERVPSGIDDLDEMLEGKGFYRGSSVMLTGTAGSGKTSLATLFANQVCVDRKRCLYIAFEESPAQIIRNVRSIGIGLEPHIKKGALRMEAWRPTQNGLEMHLLKIHKLVEEFKPDAIVIDPVTNLVSGDSNEVHSMLMRLLDFLKTQQITALLTTLTNGGVALEATAVGISSLIDTWILLRDVELNGERNRCLYVLKSRGMAHSNQVREFLFTDHGIKLIPAYVGLGNVLTGSARLAQEAREKATALVRSQETERKRTELELKRAALEGQIAVLRAQFAEEEDRVTRLIQQEEQLETQLAKDEVQMGKFRNVSSSGNGRSLSVGGGS